MNTEMIQRTSLEPFNKGLTILSKYNNNNNIIGSLQFVDYISEAINNNDLISLL